MLKNRVLVWLVVGAVAVLGGFAFFAFRFAPSEEYGPYEGAVDELRFLYEGPTKFIVSGRDDPRTRIERTEEGFAVHGVFQTDHPDHAEGTKQSPTGEIKFTVYVKRHDHFFRDDSYESKRFHFEPVR